MPHPENISPLIDTQKKSAIDDILVRNQNSPGSTMVVLNEIQEKVGYIPNDVQRYVARVLGVPLSTIHGVVSFYSFFTTKPRGSQTVKLCLGTACYVGGTSQLIDKLQNELEIRVGETTADGEITLEVCRCVGACSQAPVVMVNEDMHGKVTPQKMTRLIKDLHRKKQVE